MGIFLWCNRLFCWRSFYNVYVEVSGRLSRGQENCNQPGDSSGTHSFHLIFLAGWMSISDSLFVETFEGN